MKKKSNAFSILIYVAIFALIIFGVSALLNTANVNKPESYSEIISQFENGNVREFEMDEKGNLTYTTYTGDKYEYRVLNISLFYEDLNDTILEQVRNNEAAVKENEKYEPKDGDGVVTFNYEEPTDIPWWVSFLPYLVLIVLFIVVWIFMMNQASGRGGKLHSFGKAKAKVASDDKNKVTFKDVAGADEEKEELQEIVEFLRDPDHFTKLGAKIPRGVLLVGPPGTGKTLLAKAVAGEAGVPFYSISGSDFVEMYVGVGASRVRDLFDTARKSKASIIFIDEIDAVGRHRGAGLGGGHDEREQTLNQLLVEMDGFGTHDGVIVIAATNRPDILDPALLRPGRFDRQVTVNYPDLAGRVAILNVHAKGKPFSSDVDFEKVAQATAGMTGADLANLLNESALLAARKGRMLIGMDDIEEASIKIMVGPQKKSMKMKDDEKRKTAYHEAGHAILAYLLPSVDPVRQISIIPSGRALGYTLTPPVEDKYSVYKGGLLEEITMILGGRVAEKIILDDISGGASNDIERATSIARKMVTQLGMSDKLGPIVFGTGKSEVFLGMDFSNERNYSESVATEIDSEIHRIITECFERAEKLLSEHIDKLHFLADFLCKYEIMDDKQFDAAMKAENPDVEEIAALASEKRRKREAENEESKKRYEERKAREEEKRKKREEANRKATSPFAIFPEQPVEDEPKDDGDGSNEE